MTSYRRLDEVCDITMGQAPDGESYNAVGDGLPLIAGAGDFGEVYPEAKKFTRLPGKTCKAGDIVLGIRATIGEKVVADREYCLGRGVAGLHARAVLDSRYLWHWLSRFAPVLAAKAKGATFKQVNRQDIGELQVTVRPLSDQRRIAKVLDRAEALRAKRRAALATLDTLTQSIFLDMFGDPTTNPKSWPIVQLAELCEKVIDCPHATPMYAAARTEYPCVRSSDLQSGELDLSSAKYVERLDYEMRVKRGKPEVGDVIYCREGARFGNAARIVRDVTLCLGQRTMLFRANRTEAVGEYLWAFLLTPAAFRMASSSAGGSASPHVNIRDVIAFLVPLPPIDLQIEFARRVSAMDSLKCAHRLSLAGLDALVSSVQQRAFSGEL